MTARRIKSFGLPFGAFALLSLITGTAALANTTDAAAPWVGKQLDGKDCYNRRLPPGGGPYNYLDHLKNDKIAGVLNMVERAHFPEIVENLEAGSTGSIMADMDFTLRAFPNHHRALNSSVRYSMRYQKWPEDEKGLPAECYLQRAINFAPRDSVPLELYGFYLSKKGKFKEAAQAYDQALRIRPKDVMLNYNTALTYVKAKRYKEAMTIARALYDAGLSLPGLKRTLVAAGKWEASPEELEKLKAAMEAKAAKDPNNVPASAESNSAGGETGQTPTTQAAEGGETPKPQQAGI